MVVICFLCLFVVDMYFCIGLFGSVCGVLFVGSVGLVVVVWLVYCY